MSGCAIANIAEVKALGEQDRAGDGATVPCGYCGRRGEFSMGLDFDL
jgi:hypothetical protein